MKIEVTNEDIIRAIVPVCYEDIFSQFVNSVKQSQFENEIHYKIYRIVKDNIIGTIVKSRPIILDKAKLTAYNDKDLMSELCKQYSVFLEKKEK